MLNVVKDVFKDYKEPNNILDSKIENINLFKKSNKLEINLFSEKSITLDEIDRFEEYLKTRFQIQKIELNVEMREKGDRPLFPSEIKNDWKSIVKYISKKYPLTKAILNSSDVEKKDNKLIVLLNTKNADFLHSYEIDKEIEKIINNVYGLKIKVEFQENITEDTIKKQSEYSVSFLYPPRITEVTILPSVRNTHVCRFLLLDDPIVQQFLPFLRFNHCLQCLIVVRQIGLMTFDTRFQLDDRHYLTLFVGYHGKGLGNLAHLHVIDHLTNLLRQLLHLKPGCTHVAALILVVDHQTLVVSGIFISRDKHGRLFKRELILF